MLIKNFIMPVRCWTILNKNYAIRETIFYKYNAEFLTSKPYLRHKHASNIKLNVKLSNGLHMTRSFQTESQKMRNKTTLYYLSGLTILVGGLAYSSVLLYRLYCQSTGKGGQAILDESGEKISQMKPVKNRYITVNFNADINSSILWNFKPQQPYIKLHPGETALAFYTAKNPGDKPVTGIATYNVLPFEAGKYFNKIQCFCFEEQQLNPKEEVDLPVFFYLDPEFAEDPLLERVNDIILSYTFFEAKEGMHLPLPSFM